MDYNLSLEPDLAFVEGGYGQAIPRRLFRSGRHHGAVRDVGIIRGVVALFLAVSPQAHTAAHARAHGLLPCNRHTARGAHAVAVQHLDS